MSAQSQREILRRLFDAAVAAADPAKVLAPHLPHPPRGRTLVLAAGKAAASMARAVERHWPGDLSGLAVTRYGHGVDCANIEIIEAGHPLPDAAGRAASERFLELAAALTQDDLLLCLMSGGASALLVEPAAGLSLDEKQAVSRALLHSGAPIDEMNCVRKHLSAIKGGRLAAAAYPAHVATLAISDVPGDDPAVIGSGPTVGDPTTCADALAIAAKRGIELPETAVSALSDGRWESIKPDDPVLATGTFRLIARPADAQIAAAEAARASGLAPVLLGDDLEGEARDLAADHALLALAIALDGAPGISALACDTDGIDGTEDAAGACIGPDTLMRAAALGLDAEAMLRGHDSYTFFDRLGDLIVTGPTRTNVNDFRAICVSDPIGGGEG